MIDRSAGWALGRYSSFGFMEARGTGLGSDKYGGEITFGENTWYMVTVQYDPIDMRYKTYVDGKQVAQTGEVTQEIAVGNEPLIIGASSYQGGSQINGIIDEVQIWSYALTPVELANMYVDVITDAAICVNQTGLSFDVAGPDVDPETGDPVPDCVVDLYDFAAFAADWLNCNRVAGSTSGLVDCL